MTTVAATLPTARSGNIQNNNQPTRGGATSSVYPGASASGDTQEALSRARSACARPDSTNQATSQPTSTSDAVEPTQAFALTAIASSFSPRAHLTVSARFRGRAPGPISGQLSASCQLEASTLPPAVSCRLSATGIRFSLILFPPRDWALLTVGLPTHDRWDVDGVTAFHTHERRPGWVPSIPRGQRCSIPARRRLWPAFAASPRQVLTTPLQRPIARGSASRGINEGSSDSPVRSSPHPPPPGWNRQQLRLSPELRTPPTRSRTTHVGAGTGQQSTGPRHALRHLPNLQCRVSTQCVRPRVAPPVAGLMPRARRVAFCLCSGGSVWA
jgi:hypothetical protein